MAVLKLDSWAHLGEQGAGYAGGALVKALPPTGGLVSWHPNIVAAAACTSSGT